MDKILPPLEKIQHPSKFLVYKKIEDRFLKSLRYLNLSNSLAIKVTQVSKVLSYSHIWIFASYKI